MTEIKSKASFRSGRVEFLQDGIGDAIANVMFLIEGLVEPYPMTEVIFKKLLADSAIREQFKKEAKMFKTEVYESDKSNL